MVIENFSLHVHIGYETSFLWLANYIYVDKILISLRRLKQNEYRMFSTHNLHAINDGISQELFSMYYERILLIFRIPRD